MLFQWHHSTIDHLVSAAIGALGTLLVISLLSIPTVSTSGAQIPHGHSLFLLPGHDHRLHDHSRQERSDEPGADLETASQYPGLPRITESTSQASKLQMITQQLALLASQHWQRIHINHTDWRMPGSHTERPDPPPPRYAS